MWIQARSKPNAVHLDTKDYESVIYKGIKMVKDERGINVYSTGSDFYTNITSSFVGGSFDECVRHFLKKKYIKTINKIEKAIQNEINGNKNHKKFHYLKTMRENYLNKYNEINT
ncbi:MAG: hypothetical protein ACO393_05985 [Methylophilaceae bacterium]